MKLKKSLAPRIFYDSRVLILGSMPGEESLHRQEYYAYPQNQFWRLTAAVLEVPVPDDDYTERLTMLQCGRIALWDVIASCRREGSLDTNIREENPNTIPELLAEYPGIKAVFFNGQKAGESFRRSFGKDFFDQCGLFSAVLPSSSPANTSGFERKLESWMLIREYL
ncbi:MAG: DNA-deoxyinosine glycosylase [Spirochaetales bacterium]|uniref:DNA-deoxyinosine glycosylase n=1 Tax=Candidatus Thalassospirochaeta sargassi TaxID=3119039 RepID=A0AAJ1MMX2_9SPIO|nr:DNA-deoxyinosine glycosylase [Spirochaetales bacterium]